jgi:hypothetical protein
MMTRFGVQRQRDQEEGRCSRAGYEYNMKKVVGNRRIKSEFQVSVVDTMTEEEEQ